MKKSLKREDFTMIYDPKQKTVRPKTEKELKQKTDNKEEKERK